MTQDAPVRMIRSDEDYEAALKAIRPYFDNEPDPGTPEADRFDLLALVIKAWEDEHHPIPAPTPQAVVTHVMDANGYTRADLAEILGAPSRVSEFLRGRRELSLAQIRRLSREWKIPADALLGELATA